MDVDAVPSTSSQSTMGPPVVFCFREHMHKLKRCPWYWGDISWAEAERLLAPCPEGTYILRDSRAEDHIFTVSWRSHDKVLHSRSLLHWNAKTGPDVTNFLQKAIREAQSGEANLLMHRRGDAAHAEQCIITQPLSRFDLLPPLSYLCRLQLRLDYPLGCLRSIVGISPGISTFLCQPRFLAPDIEWAVEAITRKYNCDQGKTNGN